MSRTFLYFLQYSTFASERPQVRTWGHQIYFSPRTPLTSLRPWSRRSHAPHSVCWRLQLPACQLGLQRNMNFWAAADNLALLHNPKGAASFFSQRWREMERRHQPGPCLRECRPGQPTAWQMWSRKVPAVTQHRPFLITPPRLKVPAYSDPMKRWKFRKADWKRFCLLTGKCVERLSPLSTSNIEKAY